MGGLLLSAVWLVYFFGANLAPSSWFGPVTFDSSELPVITIYAMYIPIFVLFMRRERELRPFKRFVMPAASIACSLFMVYAAVVAHGVAVAWYLALYALVMAVGLLLLRGRRAAPGAGR